MKRGLILSLLLVSSILFSVSHVSAQYYGGAFDIPGIVDRLKYNSQQLFTPIFQAILGDYSDGQTLFVKVLFSLLIFFVVYGVVKNLKFFERSKNVGLIVSLVISILAARGVVDDGVISGLLLPYSALGVSISIFFPIFIFFIFVQQAGDSSFVRRGAWILYGVVFLTLYWGRIFGSAVYESSQPFNVPIAGELNWIYSIGIVAILVLIVFDTSAHYYFKLWKLRRWMTGVNNKTVAALQAEYLTIVNVNSPEATARRRQIELELRHIHQANVP